MILWKCAVLTNMSMSTVKSSWCYQVGSNVLRPMSDTQQSWATLLLNFVARQSCLSGFASCPTFDVSRN